MGYGVSDVGQRRRKTQLAAKKNKRRSSVAAWEGDDGTGHIGNRQTRFMLERMKKDLEKLEAPRARPRGQVAGRELRESLAALVAEEEAKEQARKPKPRQRRKAKRVVMTPAEAKAAQEARVKAQEAETAAKIKAAAESGAAFFAFDHKPKEAVVPEEEAAPKEEPSYGAGDAAPRPVRTRGPWQGRTRVIQRRFNVLEHGSTSSSQTTLTAPSVGSHKSSMQKSGPRAVAAARARQRALQGAASGQMAIAAVGAVAVGERAKDERRERTHPARDDSVFTLATGCRDNLVRVFDLATGKIQLQLKGHTAYVSSVEFNVDGGRLVSGSYDETAVVWNAVTGKKRMALLDKKSGHRKTNDIVHYVHHNDGLLVSASFDRTLKCWDPDPADELFVDRRYAPRRPGRRPLSAQGA
ncbi:WD repeat-containing protein [Aureococcus anophagefferens]|nr:WD repeat-containing protein [Aureococcus anophagefferens]